MKVGSARAAGAQPVAAIHCKVIFLHGMSPCIDPSTISAKQSMSTIADIYTLTTGAIAIAVDCP